MRLFTGSATALGRARPLELPSGPLQDSSEACPDHSCWVLVYFGNVGLLRATASREVKAEPEAPCVRQTHPILVEQLPSDHPSSLPPSLPLLLNRVLIP